MHTGRNGERQINTTADEERAYKKETVILMCFGNYFMQQAYPTPLRIQQRLGYLRMKYMMEAKQWVEELKRIK